MRLHLAILAASAITVMAAPTAGAEAGSSAPRPSTATLNTFPGSLGVQASKAAAKRQLKSLKRALKTAKSRAGATTPTTTTLRTFSATAGISDGAAAPNELPQSSGANCSWSSWYTTSNYAYVWPTAGTWWEIYCYGDGFYGTHLSQWWHFYYWTPATGTVYYGTWRKPHNQNCMWWWDVYNLAEYGPYFC